VDQGQFFCRCEKGCCFLESDAKRAEQDYVCALHPDGIVDRKLLSILDAERLYEKSEWMGSLGITGTRQICCRHQTKNPTKKGTS
jgi:hypothetical protein